MTIAFVMPCLNEEAFVGAAASSLGFGECVDPAAEDVFLILVDNGSTDQTRAIMESIAVASRRGSVRIVVEPQRGFVPARGRGALVAAELAKERGVQSERLLVLQADADTHYFPGYADGMSQALGGRQGCLLEGVIRRSEEFDAEHPEYAALETVIDAQFQEGAVTDEDDVIVDDKACGYLLSDYMRWGQHVREEDRQGGTVHAETTRLFLRARLGHGASKIRVDSAEAVSSRRRILEEPALHFATSGFPRESAWLGEWRRKHPAQWTVDEFARSQDHPDVRDACFYRRAHNVALFALLPWIVGRAADPRGFSPPDEGSERLLSLIPDLSREELVENPAHALTAVLSAIEQWPDAFR